MPEVGQQIRDAGWTQGDLIGSHDAERLCSSCLDHLEVHCTDRTYLAILTQDCDLIRGVDKEPYVELLVLLKLEEDPAQLARGNSPRLLHLLGDPCDTALTSKCWLEASIHQRFRVRKQELVEVSRSSELRLPPDERHRLKRWLGRRYTREPFPDRFETNLDANSGRVKRLFKSREAKLVSTVFIRIHNPDEKQADHRISVILAVPSEHLSNSERRDQVDSFEERLIDVFASRSGISFHCDEADNPDVRTMSEGDLTVAELRVYQRYDIDYRSVDDDAVSADDV